MNTLTIDNHISGSGQHCLRGILRSAPNGMVLDTIIIPVSNKKHNQETSDARNAIIGSARAQLRQVTAEGKEFCKDFIITDNTNPGE